MSFANKNNNFIFYKVLNALSYTHINTLLSPEIKTAISGTPVEKKRMKMEVQGLEAICYWGKPNKKVVHWHQNP